ncbi:MAG: DUF4959 domain-containing protein [Bacteroidales bacterium]|jgi:hypothetical protein|nr:DUF4959 domain-containing protein [Bacteroidales bacterium]
MKTFKKLVFAAIFLSIWQCADIKDWAASEKDSTPPDAVINPREAERLPGGALITYTLPDNSDLLAVKAVYSLTDGGKMQEAYASVQTDTIKLEGFPDTAERTVQLFCVDKSGNLSVPAEVSIHPMTPPVELIRNSLQVNATFGGVLVQWDNPSQTDVGVSLYAADSTGYMALNYTWYSNTQQGQYSFRGFDDTEREFRIQVRDRWDNYSSPLDTVLIPIYESQILGTINGIAIWERMGWAWPGTNTAPSSNPECIWRGDAAKQENASANGFATTHDGIYNSGYLHLMRPGNMLSDYTGNAADKDTHLVPIYLTIDMKRSSRLSRHKLRHRWDTMLKDNNMQNYELWATNDPPKNMSDFATKEESLAYWTSWPEVNGTDAWKQDWVKIAECFVIPPSGATTAIAVTADDITWGQINGFEFNIFPEHTATPFRYVRIVSQRNMTGGTIIHIGELEFWGAYAD